MYKLLFIGMVFTQLIMSCGSEGSGPVSDQTNSSTNKYRLVWHGDATTEITVVWDQLKGTDPTVCYGTEDFGEGDNGVRSRNGRTTGGETAGRPASRFGSLRTPGAGRPPARRRSVDYAGRYPHTGGIH